MKNSLNVILIVIVLIAALLRLPMLTQYPNGFTGDEAQQGYSAYSILLSGKDEWGEVMPLFPRGFGDYKPPLQTYLMIPSIAIFGLTIEAVRLPAAVIGVLLVLVVYYLAYEITGNRRIGIWSAFLLAINPWAIQLSRSAFEGGVGVFFFSLGLLFFLKGLKQKNYLIISAVSWGLTFYSYHSARVFLALFLIGLAIILGKRILSKKFVVFAVILAVFVLPLIFNINQILARSSDVGITSPKVIEGYFQNRTGSSLGTLDKLFDNKFLYVGNIFVSNFLSYYSPQFFFTGSRPDNSYLNFPNFPLLYQFEIILWLLAGWVLLRGKVNGKKIILLWLLLAAIPASLATGQMNAGRAPGFLPLTAIISGIGVVFLMEKLQKNWVYLLLPILISFLFFVHFYFIELPQKPADNLRYGYEQIFKKILEVQGQYNEVIISKSFTEPQIFLAFYGKMDPSMHQTASKDWLRYEQAEKNYIDQLESWNLGKYKFEGINWDKKDSLRENALIVGEFKEFPEGIGNIWSINKPSGKPLYQLVPTLPKDGQ